ncbi:hypothetical protein IM311_08350 [Enterobacter cloacae complex sp. P40RS]|uniref:Uncharacterized protein n=1 Tax=Enterobacter pasteurii TaxID=3029761 RepID=A0ABR9Q5L1_9ENTR|nr:MULTISPECIES: hypothetical protein [Enterobacter cloacae complex]MBE4854081.1 hypothetical protein [Enterobacter pasteurii]MBE4864483.1 hypothetical protein [Enterobacter cloacae complex sp. P40C2]MBE4877445.1 hypothetical protein [Enterobacter cloacae complex sp. P40C]
MSLELDVYVDDEGVSVDLILSVFGPSLAQCINLESDSVDGKMKKEIDFLIKKQKYFSDKIATETQTYSKRIYGADVKDLILLKVYLSPDEDNEFGFMFSTNLDEEHGIGIKFKGFEEKKIGSGETAFL